MTASEHLAGLRAALEAAQGHAAGLPYPQPMLAALADLLGEVDFLQAIVAAEGYEVDE